MRKELKIIGSRDRHVFTATFIRFGFRDGYKGPVKTILLQDVLLDDKIVEEVPVIKYQLETNCVFSYDKNGNIVPNPSKEWTGGDENGKWRDGTSRLDALNTQPFGFSVYAKPFLKRVIEYGNGETKVEYGRLNTKKRNLCALAELCNEHIIQ